MRRTLKSDKPRDVLDVLVDVDADPCSKHQMNVPSVGPWSACVYLPLLYLSLMVHLHDFNRTEYTDLHVQTPPQPSAGDFFYYGKKSTKRKREKASWK